MTGRNFDDSAADELTPVLSETPFELLCKQINEFGRKLEVMAEHCKQAANSSLEAVAAVNALRAEYRDLDDRVNRIEHVRHRAPLLIAIAALLLALTAVFMVSRVHDNSTKADQWISNGQR